MAQLHNKVFIPRRKIYVRPLAIITVALYFIFACLYVIACPNNIRLSIAQHNTAVKDAKQGEHHANHFKFLSRPRLILSKKSPLPVTPYFPQGGFSYAASVRTIQTGFTCAQPQTKAQLSVGVSQLFCRWLV